MLRRISSNTFTTTFGLFVLGSLLFANARLAHHGSAAGAGDPELLQPQLTPTTPSSWTYLPLTTFMGFHTPIELLGSWTSDSNQTPKSVFLPNDGVEYTVSIANTTNTFKWATVRWTQTSACGESVVAEQTMKFAPGVTDHGFSGIMQDCQGVHTNFVEVTHKTDVFPDAFQHIVTTPFHGLDKCSLPTTSQMQTWWNSSPYWTMNLYIGGISLACKDSKMGAAWISEVANQGWTYTLTWVGPQAPCTNFNNKMSGNATTAKTQGRAEAGAAVTTAQSLGFTGDQIIYYDLEGYPSNDASCRSAAAAFMQGWVERLHELGYRAGAYGGACSSSVGDWASNPSPPDVVWMAHWYKSSFTYSAHVWNTPCVGNGLWPNHQRLKQYAGDHVETWGGVPFTIDSNVLDGEVTTFQSAPATQDGRTNPALLVQPGPGEPESIRDMQLISADQGWVLEGEKLLWTRDGASWQDITPSGGGDILGVEFITGEQGWLVNRSVHTDGSAALSLLSTNDGGTSWEVADLPVAADEVFSIASAHPNLVDQQTGWVTLELQSGNNFSLGRLFATQDGGDTWEELPLPLGEPVRFIDRDRGWVTGGPLGDQLYSTRDGGRTWSEEALPALNLANGDAVYTGLPEFRDEMNGVLPVTRTGTRGSSQAIYATGDGGLTWTLSRLLDLGAEHQPAGSLPFSLDARGGWFASAPGTPRLFNEFPGREVQAITPTGFSGTIVDLEFADSGNGWALVQEGSCQGDKLSTTGDDPFRCEMRSLLVVTRDGGGTWTELALP